MPGPSDSLPGSAVLCQTQRTMLVFLLCQNHGVSPWVGWTNCSEPSGCYTVPFSVDSREGVWSSPLVSLGGAVKHGHKPGCRKKLIYLSIFRCYFPAAWTPYHVAPMKMRLYTILGALMRNLPTLLTSVVSGSSWGPHPNNSG